MQSAREQPSEPPLGERERLVAANGIAVCLATFAMVISEELQEISGLDLRFPYGFIIFSDNPMKIGLPT
jgi:hypothetical protein